MISFEQNPKESSVACLLVARVCSVENIVNIRSLTNPLYSSTNQGRFPPVLFSPLLCTNLKSLETACPFVQVEVLMVTHCPSLQHKFVTHFWSAPHCALLVHGTVSGQDISNRETSAHPTAVPSVVARQAQVAAESQ